MMSNRSMTVALAAASFMAMAVAAGAEDCKPKHQFKTLEPGKLTVAVYDAPPFLSADKEGNITGADGDILKAIAARECLAIKTIVVDPAATIQHVLSGKADIAAGDWYRSVERSKVLGLSYPTYLDQMGIYSKAGVSEINDLLGKPVGAVTGYIWVPALQKLLGADLKLYPNAVSLAQDLGNGRVEIAVDSFGTGTFAQTKGGYAGFEIKVAKPDERVPVSIEPPQAALLYSKKNSDLGEALDANIQDLHQSGEMVKILKANSLDETSANVGEPRLVK